MSINCNSGLAALRGFARFAAIAVVVIAAGAALALEGCAPSALSAARDKMTAGNFAAARQDLIALSHNSDLSARERREVKDDLCLSDFMVGRPVSTLAEQHRICADAAREPGSASAGILTQIDERSRRVDTQQVEDALAAHDLAMAERAALDYQSIPGADETLSAKWSRQIWALADQQVFSEGGAKKASLQSAVTRLREDHPEFRRMSEAQFARWVEQNTTVAGTPVATRVEMKGSTLKLSVDDTQLHLAALNLDKLAAINDAMVARCGCGARTDVAVAETGFPAYIIRLDPETRMSEVMILPRDDRAIISASAK